MKSEILLLRKKLESKSTICFVVGAVLISIGIIASFSANRFLLHPSEIISTRQFSGGVQYFDKIILHKKEVIPTLFYIIPVLFSLSGIIAFALGAKALTQSQSLLMQSIKQHDLEKAQELVQQISPDSNANNRTDKNQILFNIAQTYLDRAS
ncbi:MAG: hypothetical protein JST52_06590 [Bacteroidetes bacterium]|nr:hypothetical protein [Bacteroidota bacterium]MBS1741341.1 hypothetical protein [Bacteroidota bacterium]